MLKSLRTRRSLPLPLLSSSPHVHVLRVSLRFQFVFGVPTTNWIQHMESALDFTLCCVFYILQLTFFYTFCDLSQIIITTDYIYHPIITIILVGFNRTTRRRRRTKIVQQKKQEEQKQRVVVYGTYQVFLQFVPRPPVQSAPGGASSADNRNKKITSYCTCPNKKVTEKEVYIMQ